MRIAIFLVLIFTLVVSCALDSRIPFDESMTAIQEAGYSLAVLNVSDMRCLQGVEQDGASVVFMQVYCEIEDSIDMINFGINPAYSRQGHEKMLEALELIGFPHSEEVLDFFSSTEKHLIPGNQVVRTIGTWRVSASTQTAGTDAINFVALRSARFLDEVGP